MNSYEKQRKVGRILSTLFLIVVLTFDAVLLFIMYMTGSLSRMFSREARNADISLDVSGDHVTSVNYLLMPKVDIGELELTFEYEDKNEGVIKSVIKQVGNVKKGYQYTVIVSLAEFTFSELTKIKYQTCEVTGGFVSIFAH